MPMNILMPALSPTMTEGTLAKWLKKEGDIIKSGDIIAEIETDKAIMEYESTFDGILGKILIPEGTTGVPVNKPIGILLEEGENANDLEQLAKDSTSKETTTSPENISVSTTVEIPSVTSVSDISYAGSPTKNITVREALNEAMCEEMRRDEKVYLIGEEVGHYQGAYKVSQGMLDEFGESRIVDTPITEYGFTGLAIGSAFHGLKPIVEYMTFNFSLQALDHILNSAAKGLYMSGGQLTSPIVFRGINGAGTRVGAQHSQCLASWFAHIPGLIVVSPYSSEDAKGLLKTSIRNNNPVVFLEHEVMYGKSFEMPDVEDLILPLGKAKIEREGTDVTIVSYSLGVHWALEAAIKLAQEGISAEVINLRTLRPLDTETIIKSINKTNRLVTVEEGWSYSSIGSEIASVIMEQAFDQLDAPLVRICGKDVPMPYAANLEKMTLPSEEEIVQAVKKVCYKS